MNCHQYATKTCHTFQKSRYILNQAGLQSSIAVGTTLNVKIMWAEVLGCMTSEVIIQEPIEMQTLTCDVLILNKLTKIYFGEAAAPQQ